MMNAVISNATHPEYGAATIPFPIPGDEYDHCIELLAALEIGGAVKQDCRIRSRRALLPNLCKRSRCRSQNRSAHRITAASLTRRFLWRA